jgi:ribose transport system substrate-binding protein
MRRAWAGLGLFAVVVVTGCSGEAGPQSAVNASRGTIGVSLLNLNNPFFKVIGDTITAEAQKQGYQTVVVSADEDPARQANQVKDFLVRKVAAIVLSPCESRAIVPAIQEANAVGIPVFTVDIPCREDGVKIVCQVATDNLNGGREAARAMIEALGETGGQVAILHYKQAESCRLRVQGFREVIDEHNRKATNKIAIVNELDGGGAKDKGYRAAEDAVQTHPMLRGIFAINDPSALGGRNALEKAGKADQIVLIGFDGQPEGKQAIKEGKIYADPIQFPDRMGVEIVKAIVKHFKGEKLPPELLIPTSLYRQADALKDPELK